MALSPSRGASITAGVLAALVSLVCVRLGIWQLDRLDQRRELNESIRVAAALPEARLQSPLLDSLRSDPTSFTYRSVRVDGTFENPPLLIRGRSLDGRPGVHLIVPLRLDAGDIVLVNRGWLPSPDGATVDPRPYLLYGAHSFEATIQPLSDADAEVRRSVVPLPDYSVSSFLRLTRAVVAQEIGEEPLPVILQPSDRLADAAELPVPVAPPTLDEGPHLGYAIQWFSFAAIALVGAVVLVTRRPR